MLLLVDYSATPEAPPDAVSILGQMIEETAVSVLQPLGDTTWLIETNEDVGYWAHLLSPSVRPGHLLIVRVQGQTNGWLDLKIWEWINARAT